MKRSVLFAVPAVVALAVAGCGGGKSAYSGGSSTSSKSASSSSSAATVKATHTKLGTILVDSSGRTLYLFEKDKGTASTCSGACASAWPPLTTSGSPKGVGGVVAAKLGTTKRSDGASEVTYNGHPLYTYAGDSGPGQTNGQGLDQFGAEWYVLAPNGKKVEGGEGS